MVEQNISRERPPGKIVKMICPNCEFVIATFTAHEVEHDKIKGKRYQALRTRQQFCGGYMRTVRKLEPVWES